MPFDTIYWMQIPICISFITDLILLEFSKAFDKVSHEKLALKLYDCGIRGTALKWVKGFLDNRHQSVIVNGSSSEPVSSRETRSQTTCLWYIYIFIRTYTCLIWSTSGVCAGTTSFSKLHKWSSYLCQIQSETLCRRRCLLSYHLNIFPIRDSPERSWQPWTLES